MMNPFKKSTWKHIGTAFKIAKVLDAEDTSDPSGTTKGWKAIKWYFSHPTHATAGQKKK